MENQDEQSSSMDYVSVWRALPPSLKLSLLPLTSSAVLVTSGNDLAYALTKVFGGEDVMLADVSASLLAIHVLLSIAVFARIFEIANQRHHTLSASDQSVASSAVAADRIDAAAHFVNLFSILLTAVNLLKPAVERCRPELVLLATFVVFFFFLFPLFKLRIRVRRIRFSTFYAEYHPSDTSSSLVYEAANRLAGFLRPAPIVGLGFALGPIVISLTLNHYFLPLVLPVGPGVPDHETLWVVNPTLLFFVGLQILLARTAVGPPDELLSSAASTERRCERWPALERSVLTTSVVLDFLGLTIMLVSNGQLSCWDECSRVLTWQLCIVMFVSAAAASVAFLVAAFLAYTITFRVNSAIPEHSLVRRYRPAITSLVFLLVGCLAGAAIAVTAVLTTRNYLFYHLIWMQGLAFAGAGVTVSLAGPLLKQRDCPTGRFL